MLKKMNKTTKSNFITYGIVIVAFVVMQTLISTGSISSLLEGIMVPICIYVIMAVSLNLVVGILGELSLGHAGFMCVGAFSSAFFSKCMRDVIENGALRFFLAMLIGIVVFKLQKPKVVIFITLPNFSRLMRKMEVSPFQEAKVKSCSQSIFPQCVN